MFKQKAIFAVWKTTIENSTCKSTDRNEIIERTWIDDDSDAWLATISILYEIHRVEWYIVSMGRKIFKTRNPFHSCELFAVEKKMNCIKLFSSTTTFKEYVYAEKLVLIDRRFDSFYTYASRIMRRIKDEIYIYWIHCSYPNIFNFEILSLIIYIFQIFIIRIFKHLKVRVINNLCSIIMQKIQIYVNLILRYFVSKN